MVGPRDGTDSLDKAMLGYTVGGMEGTWYFPVPWDQGIESVSCRIFWLGGGDAWREVADGMESTPVVRGSGGMCSKLLVFITRFQR